MGEPVVLVMGVSGSGKTTIGQALARRTGWPFIDADQLHPEANIEKMRAGVPLSDADRWPWLREVAAWIERRRSAGEPGVVACSALKKSYRDLLRSAHPGLRIVYLSGDRVQLAGRLRHRSEHFFRSTLLASQLRTLEAPGPEENAIKVHIGYSSAETVELILAALR